MSSNLSIDPKTKKIDWKPYLALLAVYLIWGTTAGVIRIGSDTIPAALLPCMRFLIAGILLIAFCLLKGEHFPRMKELKIHFIIGALLFFGGNALISWTVRYIPTGFSGILVATTPLWMVGLSAVLPPREKFSSLSLLAVLIGFCGMLILLSPQLSHLTHVSSVFWVCILGLFFMTFCWSLGSIYARKHPTQNSLLLSVGVQNLFAGILMLPVCWITIPDWRLVHPSTESLSALAYLILMGTIAATPCYLFVVKTMPVTLSSTFAYVTPLLTLLFGWAFLGETITPNMMIGAAVILFGVIMLQYFSLQWNNRHSQKLTVIAERPVRLIEPSSSQGRISQ